MDKKHFLHVVEDSNTPMISDFAPRAMKATSYSLETIKFSSIPFEKQEIIIIDNKKYDLLTDCLLHIPLPTISSRLGYVYELDPINRIKNCALRINGKIAHSFSSRALKMYRQSMICECDKPAFSKLDSVGKVFIPFFFTFPDNALTIDKVGSVEIVIDCNDWEDCVKLFRVLYEDDGTLKYKQEIPFDSDLFEIFESPTSQIEVKIEGVRKRSLSNYEKNNFKHTIVYDSFETITTTNNFLKIETDDPVYAIVWYSKNIKQTRCELGNETVFDLDSDESGLFNFARKWKSVPENGYHGWANTVCVYNSQPKSGVNLKGATLFFERDGSEEPIDVILFHNEIFPIIPI